MHEPWSAKGKSTRLSLITAKIYCSCVLAGCGVGEGEGGGGGRGGRGGRGGVGSGETGRPGCSLGCWQCLFYPPLHGGKLNFLGEGNEFEQWRKRMKMLGGFVVSMCERGWGLGPGEFFKELEMKCCIFAWVWGVETCNC